MTNHDTPRARLPAALAILGAVASLGACAASEPKAVRHAAIQKLDCSPDDVYAFVNRSTPKVEEWYVGCDFKYLRVHCRADGCAPAGPRPPCMGEGECVEEDPITLQWRLVDDTQHLTGPLAGGGAH